MNKVVKPVVFLKVNNFIFDKKLKKRSLCSLYHRLFLLLFKIRHSSTQNGPQRFKQHKLMNLIKSYLLHSSWQSAPFSTPSIAVTIDRTKY